MADRIAKALAEAAQAARGGKTAADDAAKASRHLPPDPETGRYDPLDSFFAQPTPRALPPVAWRSRMLAAGITDERLKVSGVEEILAGYGPADMVPIEAFAARRPLRIKATTHSEAESYPAWMAPGAEPGSLRTRAVEVVEPEFARPKRDHYPEGTAFFTRTTRRDLIIDGDEGARAEKAFFADEIQADALQSERLPDSDRWARFQNELARLEEISRETEEFIRSPDTVIARYETPEFIGVAREVERLQSEANAARQRAMDKTNLPDLEFGHLYSPALADEIKAALNAGDDVVARNAPSVLRAIKPGSSRDIDKRKAAKTLLTMALAHRKQVLEYPQDTFPPDLDRYPIVETHEALFGGGRTWVLPFGRTPVEVIYAEITDLVENPGTIPYLVRFFTSDKEYIKSQLWDDLAIAHGVDRRLSAVITTTFSNQFEYVATANLVNRLKLQEGRTDSEITRRSVFDGFVSFKNAPQSAKYLPFKGTWERMGVEEGVRAAVQEGERYFALPHPVQAAITEKHAVVKKGIEVAYGERLPNILKKIANSLGAEVKYGEVVIPDIDPGKTYRLSTGEEYVANDAGEIRVRVPYIEITDAVAASVKTKGFRLGGAVATLGAGGAAASMLGEEPAEASPVRALKAAARASTEVAPTGFWQRAERALTPERLPKGEETALNAQQWRNHLAKHGASAREIEHTVGVALRQLEAERGPQARIAYDEMMRLVQFPARAFGAQETRAPYDPAHVGGVAPADMVDGGFRRVYRQHAPSLAGGESYVTREFYPEPYIANPEGEVVTPPQAGSPGSHLSRRVGGTDPKVRDPALGWTRGIDAPVVGPDGEAQQATVIFEVQSDFRPGSEFNRLAGGTGELDAWTAYSQARAEWLPQLERIKTPGTPEANKFSNESMAALQIERVARQDVARADVAVSRAESAATAAITAAIPDKTRSKFAALSLRTAVDAYQYSDVGAITLPDQYADLMADPAFAKAVNDLRAAIKDRDAKIVLFKEAAAKAGDYRAAIERGDFSAFAPERPAGQAPWAGGEDFAKVAVREAFVAAMRSGKTRIAFAGPEIAISAQRFTSGYPTEALRKLYGEAIPAVFAREAEKLGLKMREGSVMTGGKPVDDETVEGWVREFDETVLPTLDDPTLADFERARFIAVKVGQRNKAWAAEFHKTIEPLLPPGTDIDAARAAFIDGELPMKAYYVDLTPDAAQAIDDNGFDFFARAAALTAGGAAAAGLLGDEAEASPLGEAAKKAMARTPRRPARPNPDTGYWSPIESVFAQPNVPNETTKQGWLNRFKTFGASKEQMRLSGIEEILAQYDDKTLIPRSAFDKRASLDVTVEVQRGEDAQFETYLAGGADDPVNIIVRPPSVVGELDGGHFFNSAFWIRASRRKVDDVQTRVIEEIQSDPVQNLPRDASDDQRWTDFLDQQKVIDEASDFARLAFDDPEAAMAKIFTPEVRSALEQDERRAQVYLDLYGSNNDIFAGALEKAYRQDPGFASVRRILEDGASAADLEQQIRQTYPELEAVLSLRASDRIFYHLMFARNTVLNTPIRINDFQDRVMGLVRNEGRDDSSLRGAKSDQLTAFVNDPRVVAYFLEKSRASTKLPDGGDVTWAVIDTAFTPTRITGYADAGSLARLERELKGWAQKKSEGDKRLVGGRERNFNALYQMAKAGRNRLGAQYVPYRDTWENMAVAQMFTQAPKLGDQRIALAHPIQVQISEGHTFLNEGMAAAYGERLPRIFRRTARELGLEVKTGKVTIEDAEPGRAYRYLEQRYVADANGRLTLPTLYVDLTAEATAKIADRGFRLGALALGAGGAAAAVGLSDTADAADGLVGELSADLGESAPSDDTIAVVGPDGEWSAVPIERGETPAEAATKFHAGERKPLVSGEESSVRRIVEARNKLSGALKTQSDMEPAERFGPVDPVEQEIGVRVQDMEPPETVALPSAFGPVMAPTPGAAQALAKRNTALDAGAAVAKDVAKGVVSAIDPNLDHNLISAIMADAAEEIASAAVSLPLDLFDMAVENGAVKLFGLANPALAAPGAQIDAMLADRPDLKGQMREAIAGARASAVETVEDFMPTPRGPEGTVTGEVARAFGEWMAVFALTRKLPGLKPVKGWTNYPKLLGGVVVTDQVIDYEETIPNIIEEVTGQDGSALARAVTEYFDLSVPNNEAERKLKGAIEALGSAWDWLALDGTESAMERRTKTMAQSLAFSALIDPAVKVAGLTAKGVAKAPFLRALTGMKKAHTIVEASRGDPDAALRVQEMAERETVERVSRLLGGDPNEPLVSFDGDALEAGALGDDRVTLDFGRKMYVNFARIDAPEDVQAVIGQMADAATAEINGMRGGPPRTFEQMRAEADAAMSADEGHAFKALTDRRAGDPLSDVDALAARSLWVSSGKRLREIAQKAATTGAKADLFAFRRMMQIHASIQSHVISARTATARALASWRIPRGDDAAMMRLIDEAVAASDVSDVRALAQRLADVDVMAAERLIEVTARGGWTRVFEELWVNALLWSPLTHAVNAAGNMSAIIGSIATRASAGALPGAKAAGAESVEALHQAAGVVEAMSDAWRYAGAAFVTRQAGRATGKLDQLKIGATRAAWTLQPKTVERISRGAQRVGLNADVADGLAAGVASVGPAIEAVLTTPTRTLTAADEFFRTLNFRGALRREAYVVARKELAGGEIAETDLARRIDEVFHQMTDGEAEWRPVIERAITEAERATFTNGSTRYDYITNASKAFQRIPIIGRIVLPFVNTPANLMRFAFSHTPLAPFIHEYREAIRAGGREAHMARTKVALGTSAMVAVYNIVNQQRERDGLPVITGAGPMEPGVREALQRSGWQPYSVRVGDRYFAYNRLDPYGMILGFAADMSSIAANSEYTVERAEEMEEVAAAIVASISANMLSRHYLSGLASLIDWVANPERPDKADAWINRTAGAMIVPNFAPPIRRVVDPEMRYAHNLVTTLMNRTPGLSADLPPQRDFWGRVRTYQSGLGAVYDLTVPMMSRRWDPEPIDQEIIRQGLDVRLPNRSLTLGGARVSLRNRPDVYSRLLEVRGEMKLGGKTMLDRLNGLIETSAYKRASDGEGGMKDLMIRTIISSYTEAANNQIKKELTEAGDPLIGTLKVRARVRRSSQAEADRLLEGE